MGKVVKMESNTSEELNSSKLNQDNIAAAKKAYDDLSLELSTKKYIVEGGKQTAEVIKSFLETDVQWTSNESLGAIKTYEDIKYAMKQFKVTSNELVLPVLCIKALSYFIGKISGTGIKEAEDYKNLLFTPLNNAMGNIVQDEKKLEELQHNWNVAAQGLDLEEVQ